MSICRSSWGLGNAKGIWGFKSLLRPKICTQVPDCKLFWGKTIYLKQKFMGILGMLIFKIDQYEKRVQLISKVFCTFILRESVKYNMYLRFIKRKNIISYFVPIYFIQAQRHLILSIQYMVQHFSFSIWSGGVNFTGWCWILDHV